MQRVAHKGRKTGEKSPLSKCNIPAGWASQFALLLPLKNVRRSRLVIVLESGIGLESGLKYILAGLGLGLEQKGLETAGLGLDSDLGRFITKSSFSFHCAHFAVFCLGCMTFCQAVSYTQPKISVTYLIFTAKFTRGLACFDSIYCLLGDEFSTEGMEMQLSQYQHRSALVMSVLLYGAETWILLVADVNTVAYLQILGHPAENDICPSDVLGP